MTVSCHSVKPRFHFSVEVQEQQHIQMINIETVKDSVTTMCKLVSLIMICINKLME